MRKLSAPLALSIVLLLAACGGPEEEPQKTVKTPDTELKKSSKSDPEIDWQTNKGIGPVTEITLAEAIDQKLAEEGKVLFEKNCAACHKTDKKYIGPAPKDILDRRTPEWVMNMIINPTEMVQKDPLAKKLLAEANGAIMADQNITEEQARAILEYFRTL